MRSGLPSGKKKKQPRETEQVIFTSDSAAFDDHVSNVKIVKEAGSVAAETGMSPFVSDCVQNQGLETRFRGKLLGAPPYCIHRLPFQRDALAAERARVRQHAPYIRHAFLLSQ